ncbi:WD40 repeat-containing protein [Burkholderiales bacterium JOSHI_001]|nr:WD40 repeat-containing protein [Burkholderiales bacterium JOSHI_001]
MADVELTGPEAQALLAEMKNQLSPVDLALLQHLCELLPDHAPQVSVGQAIQVLYPGREHGAAIDALGKLVKRLATAAQESGVNLALATQGAKKLGTARTLSFQGTPATPQARMPALERHASHLVPLRGVPDQRVLLVLTVNSNETQAVFDVFCGPGTAPLVVERRQRTYHELGRHGGFRVLHTTCEMGSGTPGGAQATITRAIGDWQPEAVLAVGVAFGVNLGKQAEADVLVSQHLLPYEAQRVNKNGSITARGGKVPASTAWLNRVRSVHNTRQRHASDDWPVLHIGTLLSGEKLVDNLDYRKSLTQMADKVVGGEMEGGGVFTATESAETKVHWLVIKAISDWADGSKAATAPEQELVKDALQRRAATQAARVAKAAIDLAMPPALSDEPCHIDHPHDMPPERAFAALAASRDRLVPPRGVPTSLHKGPLAEEARPTPAAKSEGVDALVHVQSWLDDPHAPPVFALLGEYGMGKTLLCQQLAQQLNGAPPGQAGARRAFYFDLRDLVNLRDRVPTLDEVVAECIRVGYAKGGRPSALTPQRVHQAFDAGALVIFDGLDEALVHMDASQGQAFTRGLLQLAGPQARGRLLLSCRTQYFRTLREQNTHFTAEDRSDKTADSFAALCLLPFEEDQIRSYLQRSVPGTDINQLMVLISSVHNLPEMAQRPYTLSLIAPLLPRIEQRIAAGEPVQGVTLYRDMVLSWLERDATKHHLKPEHKLQLARDLAAELWRRGQRHMDVQALEAWFLQWLGANPLLERRYHGLSMDKLEEDLRNSTFLSRQDGSDDNQGLFRFAHSSLQEFFLASYLFDAAHGQRPLDWALPVPSEETLDFLGQMFMEGTKGASALGQLADWRVPYRPQTSELLLAYALQAQRHGAPLPLLSGMDLHDANLQDWQVGADDLPTLDLAGARLDRANLRDSRFENVSLAGAGFMAADLRGAVLVRCQLQRANFRSALATGAGLHECELQGADFTGADGRGLLCSRARHAPALPAGALRTPKHAASRPTQARAALARHTASPSACAFSPDSQFIVSASDDHSLRLWNAATGECLRTFSGHSGTVSSCDFSPDGQVIVSASGDQSLRLWNATTGECLHTLSAHSSRVTSCAFSLDGQFIVSSHDQSLRLWNAATGECLRTLSGHFSYVTSCAFSPDSQFIVSASWDNSLRLWNAATGECLRTLSGHSQTVTSCAFSPDGQFIVSASQDNSLRLWNAATGECLRTLSGHSSSVTSCAFSQDGRFIVSASRDNSLRLWNAATGECLRTLSGHSETVTSCAFSLDGQFIVSASNDNSLRLWSAATGECLRTLSGHSSYVTSCAFSPDGQFIVSSHDQSLRLWNAATGECLRTLSGHSSYVTSCAFSPDSQFIVSASQDNSLRLWNAATGECLRTLSGHSSSVTSCAFSPDGRFIVSASIDNSLCLWNAATGECLRTLSGQSHSFASCAISPDSQFIVSASWDNCLHLWNAATGECLRTLSGHSRSVTSCAISPDGQFIVSASDDSSLRLWNAATGECLRILSGHSETVTSCAFSPGGQFIVSTSWDNSLRLWNAATGECLRTLVGHSRSVTSCAVSPDGQFIVSASDDSSLRIWNAATGDCLRSSLHLSGGHATVDLLQNRVLEASGDAWRLLGWEGQDDAGRPVRWPLEWFGPVPEPAGA